MPNDFVLRGAKLIDSTGAPAKETAVAISGQFIAPIDGERFTEPRIMDLAGLTLLPGLIDAHTHLGLTNVADQYDGKVPAAVLAAQIFNNARNLLDAGFTTVRDAGGVDGGLVRAIEGGQVRGPRVLPSGPILCQTGGHGDWGPTFHPHGYGIPGLSTPSLICDGPDEVRRAARTALRRGATQLKVCVTGGATSLSDDLADSQFSVEELSAVVAEARARSTYVTAHAHTVGGIRNGLRAGVECFEHGTFLDEATARAMAAASVPLVPTLAIHHVAADEWEQMGIPQSAVPRLQDMGKAAVDSIRLAQAAGVAIGSGSDLVGPEQQRFGLELVLKARILGPMAAIVSATATNARILRLSDSIGTVEVGKQADLIAVRGDPLQDPEIFSDPSQVVMVFKGGEIVKDAR